MNRRLENGASRSRSSLHSSTWEPCTALNLNLRLPPLVEGHAAALKFKQCLEDNVGPGDYFSWPEVYFQYRTFGLPIRGGPPAGRSTLDVYQVVDQTIPSIDNAYIQTSLNVFRDTTVGTCGWKYNQGFTNKNPVEKNVLPDNRADQPGQICLSSSAPLDCDMNWRLTNNWETNGRGA